MREGAKKRLTGAVVIVALAVIFVPMLFEPESLDSLPPIQQSIPRPPAFAPEVQTEVFLGPADSGVGGLADSAATVSQPLPLPPAGAPTPGVSGRPASADGAGAPPVAKPAADPAPGKPAKPVPNPLPNPASGKPAAGPDAATPRAAGAAMPSWVIQVASIPNAEGAAELEGKLRAGGFAAFIEKAEVNGRIFYRVKVGPELDRARAEQTAARLREKHKVEPLIKSYP